MLLHVVFLSSRGAWASYIEAQGSKRECPKSEHSKREEKLPVLLQDRSTTGTVSLIPYLVVKAVVASQILQTT